MKTLMLALMIAGSAATGMAADGPYALFATGNYAEAARAGQAAGGAAGLALAARAVLTDAMLREVPCQDCLEHAEALARAALAADPGRADADIWLAAALGYQVRINGILFARLHGIPEEAGKLLQAALKEEPDNPVAASALGSWNIEVVRGAGGMLASLLYGASESQALAQFDRAARLAPDNVMVRYQIGVSLAGYNVDKYRDRILQELDAAIRAQPQTAYEHAVQARAVTLAALLRHGDRLTFDNKVRIWQGYR